MVQILGETIVMSLGLGRKKTKTVHLGAKGSFTEHPGALHEALGIPQGEKIPASDKEPHPGDSPRLKRMRASAKGFAHMNK
jgi:hypothetical protein